MYYSKQKIEEIQKKYNLPLYIFDETGFIENYKLLEKEMREYYPSYNISYSFKTNYTPYICKTVKDLGGYAEVVSGMEYSIAKRIGYRANQIIINGPYKDSLELEGLINGSLVNVDSLEELNKYISLAQANKEKTIKVGIRVNLDIGQSFVSRFGLDEKDIEKAFALTKNVSNLRISGIHCHISRCRDIDSWRRRTERILYVVDKYFETIPDYIDLGSGMFGQMDSELLQQFSDVPTYKDYARVTAKLVSEHFVNSLKKPLLFTEPGTTLVNKYVDVVAQIESIKNIKEKTFVTLDCSMHNLGEICTLKNIPIEIIPCGKPTAYYKNVSYVGYTCLEQDVMKTGCCANLAVGDYVIFKNVGGYSNVCKPPFIRPNFAMLAIDRIGNYKLMKKSETEEDLLSTYCF